MSVTAMKTPGVYVRELDAFGNSVVPVPTAIPAFIGYTGQTSFNGKDLVQQAVKINSLADFNAIFGSKPPEIQFSVTAIDPTTGSKEAPNFSLGKDGYSVATKSVNYRLHSAVKFFYENGGGTCYIVSVGGYDYAKPALNATDPFTDALELLKKEDEPTMIVIPDAVELKNDSETEWTKKYQLCYALQGQMINHCDALTSRIALLDVPGGYNEPKIGATSVEGFRSVGGTTAKSNSYAAAYYPWVHTTVNQLGDVSYANIDINSQAVVQKMLHTEFPQIPGVNGAAATDNPFKKYIDELFGDGVTAVTAPAAAATPVKTSNNTRAIDAIIAKLKASGDPSKDPLKKAIAAAETAKGLITTSDTGVKIALNTAWITAADTTIKAIDTAVTALKPTGGKPEPTNVTLAIADSTAAKGIIAAALKAATATGAKEKDVLAGATASKTALEHALASAQTAEIPENDIEKWTAMANTPIMGATTTSAPVPPTSKTSKVKAEKADTVLKNLSTSYKMLLNSMLDELNLMPPSAAMAGVYTIVDNTEGVWVAPANVAMQSVVSPAVKIDHKTQEDLNVPLDGKSVCAIRSFPGHGVMVWGARTMDGNSNDWRYINVRRTLIFIEQSVKEAARAYVFAPNDANTWVSVKSMIGNFLLGLWNQGGLVGSKPADAFSVSIGLGSTMTGEDILEGKMIVAVKVAVSHPAEFIDITFQQQMQK